MIENTSSNNLSKDDLNYTLGLLLFFVALGSIILITESNRTLFLHLNQVSNLTGEMIWQWITVLGDGFLTAIILLLFINRRPKIAWSFVLSTVIYMIILHSLKDGLGVKRPPGVLPHDSFNIIGPKHSSGSFPSGHTTTIFTLLYVIVLDYKNKTARILLPLLALLIGFGRIAVGVHWPLDICGGALLGIISAYLGYWLAGVTEWGYSQTGKIIFYLLLVPGCIYMLLFYSTGYSGAFYFTRAVGSFCLIYWLVDFLRYRNIL